MQPVGSHAWPRVVLPASTPPGIKPNATPSLPPRSPFAPSPPPTDNMTPNGSCVADSDCDYTKKHVNGLVCTGIATKVCSCQNGVDVCSLIGQCKPYCEQPEQVVSMNRTNSVSVASQFARHGLGSPCCKAA